MKKLFLIPLILLNVYAATTVDINETNKSATELNITSGTVEKNTTQSSAVFETDTTQYVQPSVQEEDFNDTYVTVNNSVNLAVVIDKQKFFKYLPSLINSLNAYFISKGIDFKLNVYDIDKNISEIKANDIIYVMTDPKKVKNLTNYNKTFYLPLINKTETDITARNIYFGSIDFKEQLNKLTSFIDAKTDVITDDTILAKKLFNYEKNLTFLNNVYKFPNIYYRDLNSKFVIFNISAGKTAQVLSTITQKAINTKLNFIPQFGYDPLMIMLTQPQDIQKLLISNSIIHPPMIINEYDSLLNSNIRYNWINYASCILANKAYNRQNGEDEFYMSDFNIYIFDNQINYKTRLYRIIDGAFKQVE
jgi:hypothetical protein